MKVKYLAGVGLILFVGILFYVFLQARNSPVSLVATSPEVKQAAGVEKPGEAMPGASAEYEVAQKNRAFTVDHLKIKVGDTVNFTNNDPYFHNVFSLSETKTFDLGSYPQGYGRTVTFDEPGTVEVECAIHPDMKMTLEVAK